MYEQKDCLYKQENSLCEHEENEQEGSLCVRMGKFYARRNSLLNRRRFLSRRKEIQLAPEKEDSLHEQKIPYTSKRFPIRAKDSLYEQRFPIRANASLYEQKIHYRSKRFPIRANDFLYEHQNSLYEQKILSQTSR